METTSCAHSSVAPYAAPSVDSSRHVCNIVCNIHTEEVARRLSDIGLNVLLQCVSSYVCSSLCYASRKLQDNSMGTNLN